MPVALHLGTNHTALVASKGSERHDRSHDRFRRHVPGEVLTTRSSDCSGMKARELQFMLFLTYVCSN